MDEILQQLGILFFGAVPTILLFLSLVLAYRFLVHGPLSRTLKERRERTLGAVEKAHAAIAAADAKSQEYEALLRAARMEILKAREVRMQEWIAQRDNALDAARGAAQERVKQARTALEAEETVARRQIESTTDQLATQILKAILPADMAPAEISR